MNIIQLSLFTDCEGAGCAPARVIEMKPTRKPASPAEISVRPATCEYKEPAARAGFNSDPVLNPCKGCPLAGLCSDDCGQLGFAIDVNDPVKAGWKLRKGFKVSK